MTRSYQDPEMGAAYHAQYGGSEKHDAADALFEAGWQAARAAVTEDAKLALLDQIESAIQALVRVRTELQTALKPAMTPELAEYNANVARYDAARAKRVAPKPEEACRFEHCGHTLAAHSLFSGCTVADCQCVASPGEARPR